MSASTRHTVFKFIKLLVIVATVGGCGLFLIVSGTTYLFFNSMAKHTIADQKHAPKRLEAKINVSDPVRSQTREVPIIHKPKQTQSRDARLKRSIEFIKSIVELRKDSRLSSAPPICDIICNKSTWRKSVEGEEVWDRLNSFLEKDGSRAFDDPKFRLAFEFANSYADMLLVAGEAWEKFEPLIQRKHDLSEVEKLYWSTKAPIVITHVATKISGLIPKTQRKSEIVKKIIGLSNQCDQHSITEIKNSCLVLGADF